MGFADSLISTKKKLDEENRTSSFADSLIATKKVMDSNPVANTVNTLNSIGNIQPTVQPTIKNEPITKEDINNITKSINKSLKKVAKETAPTSLLPSEAEQRYATYLKNKENKLNNEDLYNLSQQVDKNLNQDTYKLTPTTTSKENEIKDVMSYGGGFRDNEIPIAPKSELQYGLEGGLYGAERNIGGMVQGLTGIVDAPLQNIQEGATKQQESTPKDELVKTLYDASVGEYGLYANTIEDIYKILNDNNKSNWEKAGQVALELLNNNPVSRSLENTGKAYEIIRENFGGSGVKDIQNLRDIINTPSKKIKEDAEQKYKDYGLGEKYDGKWYDPKNVGDLSETVGNMAPSIIASALTGNPNIGLAAMGVSAKGTSTEEALQKGADISQANAIGTAKGLTEIATEKLTGGLKYFGGGTLDELADKVVDKVAKGPVANYVLKQILGGVGEVAEETISDVVGVGIDKVTTDPNAKYTFEDWKKTAIMTLLSTGILNTTYDAAGYLSTGKTQYQINKEQLQQTQAIQNAVDIEMENTDTSKMSNKEIRALRNQVEERITNQVADGLLDIISASDEEALYQGKRNYEENQELQEVEQEDIKDTTNALNLEENVEENIEEDLEENTNEEQETTPTTTELELNLENQTQNQTQNNINITTGLEDYIKNNNLTELTQENIDDYINQILEEQQANLTEQERKSLIDEYQDIIKDYAKDNGIPVIEAPKIEIPDMTAESKSPSKAIGRETRNEIKNQVNAFNRAVKSDQYKVGNQVKEQYKNLEQKSINKLDNDALKYNLLAQDNLKARKTQETSARRENVQPVVQRKADVSTTIGQSYAKTIRDNVRQQKPTLAKNQETGYNKKQRNDFTKALESKEWKAFYKKIDNHGIENKQPGSKNITFVNDKIVLSEHDGTRPNVYDVYQGINTSSDIAKKIGIKTEDIIQDIYEISQEEGIDERKVKENLEKYFDKGLLRRYNSDNNVFVNQNEQTRNDVESNIGNIGEQQGRKTNISKTNQTNRELEDSSFLNEKTKNTPKTTAEVKTAQDKSKNTLKNSVKAMNLEEQVEEKKKTKTNDNLAETKKDEVLQLKTDKGKKIDLKKTSDNIYERVETPKKTDVMPDMSNDTVTVGDKKVSNFYSNITEKSKFITEENRASLQDNENLKYYNAITNKDTLLDAMGKLDANAEQQIGDFFAKDSFNAEDMATGWILIKRYQDAGNYEAMSNVIETMREKGTKSGQAIQMLGMLDRLTPEGMEFYAQRQLDNAYNKFVENKSKKEIDKYAQDFTLTPEEHQFIKDTMEKVEKMTNEDDKKVEVAKIVKMLSDKLPPEKGSRIKAWMRISMLGNPKTQVRNVVGNAIIQPFNWLGDTLASRIDKVMSKKTGIRTIGDTDFGALTGGAFKGVKETIRDAKLGIDTKDINLDRFQENIGSKPFYEGHKSKALNAGAKVLNKTNQILGYVMSGGDRIFSQAIYDNSLKNQMKLNNVTTPTPEMMQIAEQEALSRTWNDSNEYTKAVLQIRNAMNKLNVKGYGLGDVLVPFAKTPANLTKAIVDYSPVGLVRSILQDGKNYRNSLQNGQFNAQIQHKFADSLGKGFAGTVLWTAAYALAQAGITSGASDDDKDVANFMRNTLGIQPYSIKIGDKSFTYDWAQPIAAPFAAMADFKRLSEKEEKDFGTIVQTLVSSASNILLEQSFLSSIQDVFNSYEGPAAAIKQQIEDLPARATPTFFKQIADLIDPVQRQTYVKGNTAETVKNKVQVKIPGASKELTAQRDTLGREIKKYGGDDNIAQYAFNVFLNPANTNKGKPSAAAEEIYDVYKNTGDKTVMPRQVGYSENVGGTTIPLSAEERNEWQRLSGEKIEDSVKALTSNPKYNSMSYEDKADVINGIVNYSFAKAKSDMFGTQISTTYKTAAKKEAEGIPIADYYVDRISKRK